MRTKILFLITLVVVACMALTGCQPAAEPANPPAAAENENAPNDANLTDQPVEPVEQAEPEAPAQAAEELTLVTFDSADQVFHILYPEGWATNQVPLENGLSFGIAPLPEHFDAGPVMFNDPVIMVYGSVQQTTPDLAAKENVENFHLATFYGQNSPFAYQIVGEPAVLTPSPYVIYYLTQADSLLPTGVLTYWMLGTALADQTVVSFAVGVPDHSMGQYGPLAQQIFNSVEIDTSVTAELVQ